MRSEQIDLARRLVGFKTVSDEDSTRDIADFISNLLEQRGFFIDQHTYKRNGKEKVNVIARRGPEGLPALALSGHIDTVPFRESEWRSDPLSLTERDGRFYGRGACDMKGFFGVAVAAASRVPASDLRQPVSLVFTSDEEVGCIGARNLTRDRGQIAKRFVIGEPTELQPFTLHKGYVYLRVTLKGKGGHSSQPKAGLNVIERAVPIVIQRLLDFRDALQSVKDDRLDPPYATLNIGKISSGKNAAKNIIADFCQIELDVRPIPGQDVSDIVHACKRHLAPDGHVNGITVDVGLARAPTPPFLTERDADIVTESEAVFGRESASTSFNTEGGTFNATGSHSVICGLGSIAQAHQPNEYAEAIFFSDETVGRFESLVRRFCC